MEIKIKIFIGSDHVATELKATIINHIRDMGIDISDEGVNSRDSVDYPVIAFKVANKVANEFNSLGILICGTGIGMSIAANKIRGIRAAVCSEAYSARMSKTHNNANILCMGSRVVGEEVSKSIIDAWIGSEFEGGRHATRVKMIDTEIDP